MMTRMPRAAMALAITILLAACSTGASPTATDSEAAPSASQSVVPATANPDEATISAWRATAAAQRGMNGQQLEVECPPGGEPYNVWGTDVYTDDSSVCTAAVHAGAITFEDGGLVTIEIRPGEDSYEESERNGVTSLPYPAWGGSFVIVDD